MAETDGTQKAQENGSQVEIAATENEQESYTLEILRAVKEAQQQHGLRHGDYQRYRQYCARRLRRIRKCLHFPQGVKNKVQPKKITIEILKDVKFLLIPLFEAERAWAYAMQLKEEANTEPRKGFHEIRRMRKSVKHAELLLILCESDRCDARTKLEAQAYNAWIKGIYFLELSKWQIALESLTKAKTIYEKLSGTLLEDHRLMYLQRVEEIMPNLRYCAYNIGDESAARDLVAMRAKSGHLEGLSTQLDDLIEKTREKQAASFLELTWRGRTVPVRAEQVRLALLTLQELEQQLEGSTGDADQKLEDEGGEEEGKLSLYDSILRELINAQQALKEEFKDDQQFKMMTKGQQDVSCEVGKVPNSVYLHSYLSYQRQNFTVERNLLLIQSYRYKMEQAVEGSGKKGGAKPQDLVRLYDVVIQNLSEIPYLPGLQDNTAFEEEIKAKILGFKAFRCYYIAQTYLFSKKWVETIALFERTLKYGEEALKAIKDSGVVFKDKEDLQQLMKDVEGQKYSCQAASLLEIDNLTEQVSNLALEDRKKALIDRLERYYEDPSLAGKKHNLVQFPPDFEPVPCKPLFFDVASSLVAFPNLDDKLEKSPQAAGGGISGFVKGWLFGGKKT